MLVTCHAAFVPGPKPAKGPPQVLPPSTLPGLGPPQQGPSQPEEAKQRTGNGGSFSPSPIHRRASQRCKPKPTHHTVTWGLGLFPTPSPRRHVLLARASSSAPLPPLGCKEGGESPGVSLNIDKRNQEKELLQLSSSIK